jgi:hypothetical protein
VRAFFIAALFSTLVWGNSSLHDVIRSYIGQSRYETQKNLIDVLFASNKTFVKADGSIDNVGVIDVLKKKWADSTAL